MMTYLKHVGNFKHSNLKTKKFEEIQALYEKIKRSDEDSFYFWVSGEERLIKKMNEKKIDSSKMKRVEREEIKKEDNEIMEKKSVISRLNIGFITRWRLSVNYKANGNNHGIQQSHGDYDGILQQKEINSDSGAVHKIRNIITVRMNESCGVHGCSQI
ncbi:hypothetical protein Tco_1385993 [Tanacetum coccineum]